LPACPGEQRGRPPAPRRGTTAPGTPRELRASACGDTVPETAPHPRRSSPPTRTPLGRYPRPPRGFPRDPPLHRPPRAHLLPRCSRSPVTAPLLPRLAPAPPRPPGARQLRALHRQREGPSPLPHSPSPSPLGSGAASRPVQITHKHSREGKRDRRSLFSHAPSQSRETLCSGARGPRCSLCPSDTSAFLPAAAPVAPAGNSRSVRSRSDALLGRGRQK